MKLFKTTQIYGLDVIDDNNKKKERVEGRRDSTQRDTRVKTEQNDATDVTSAGFGTGQLRNSLSNFETWLMFNMFNFGKPGDFETGPLQFGRLRF
jgi:hypothetical protein